MTPFKKFLWIIAFVVFIIPAWSVLLLFGLNVLIGPLAASMIFLGIMLLYGWAAYSFFHYRYVRQQEFLHLLATTAEMEMPLAPAVWAFVRDRPREPLREFWAAFLLFFLLPGYYWLRHRRHSYDRKIEDVACLLEVGLPLHQALAGVPGVVPRDTILAAAIGQATGKLGYCLRQAGRFRVSAAWIDAVPRLVYPLALLSVVVSVLSFWAVFLAPKLQVIFRDFKLHLPAATEGILNTSRWIARFNWLEVPLFLSLVVLVAYLFAYPSACWSWPVIGRLYRIHLQGRVLKMLGLLLDTGTPLPEALQIMTKSGFFQGGDVRRLSALLDEVQRGEPLADAMQRHKLLPHMMAALVHAAQRAQNLPWALMELGDHLAQRTVRLTQRITLAIFPVAVVVMGLVVGFIAIAMFFPLVQILQGLAPNATAAR